VVPYVMLFAGYTASRVWPLKVNQRI